MLLNEQETKLPESLGTPWDSAWSTTTSFVVVGVAEATVVKDSFIEARNLGEVAGPDSRGEPVRLLTQSDT